MLSPALGYKESKEFTTQVRVIYADTDKMGVVYHAKYLEFFEIGRNEMLRDVQFTYKALEENGVFLPIIEVHLNYLRPALYDDLLTIKTKVYQDAGKLLRFKIACKVFSGDLLITEGYTVHVISNSVGRPIKPPKELYDKLMYRLFGEVFSASTTNR
jgi:acyl-CoA thioester hydrolase